jgi:hypothetical protein
LQFLGGTYGFRLPAVFRIRYYAAFFTQLDNYTMLYGLCQGVFEKIFVSGREEAPAVQGSD